MSFSVIVPVYNEANGLGERARHLVTGLSRNCEVVFVCNGCTDGSEAILEEAVGPNAKVLKCEKGKARAIRFGEAHCSLFPRFYVDSDVWISGQDLTVLAQTLEGGLELVSPLIRFDFSGASWIARALSEFWLSLPHGQNAAFHHVLGISENLRARWQEFPDLMADDTFIESHARDTEKIVVPNVWVKTRPPRTWWAWVRVRVRWQQGLDQFRHMGHAAPQSIGQMRAILGKATKPRRIFIAAIYILSVLLARILARSGLYSTDAWITDETSRG